MALPKFILDQMPKLLEFAKERLDVDKWEYDLQGTCMIYGFDLSTENINDILDIIKTVDERELYAVEKCDIASYVFKTDNKKKLKKYKKNPTMTKTVTLSPYYKQ